MVSIKAERILREIEAMTERHFLPIVGPQKGRVLVKVIRKTKPKRVLEIGPLIGYSAILMGKELDNDAQLVTIEIHADEAKMARENIERAEIPPAVRVVTGDARRILPRFDGTFDLVFMGADKREYLRMIEDRLHKGSVVIADNAGIFADQMGDYLDYVRSSGKYSSRYVPVAGDGLEVSVKL